MNLADALCTCDDDPPVYPVTERLRDGGHVTAWVCEGCGKVAYLPTEEELERGLTGQLVVPIGVNAW